MLLLAVCATLGVSAQTSVVQGLYSVPASGSQLLDTVTNATTVPMSSTIVKGAPNSTTVTVTYAKLTGTMAGVLTLQGSNNATDWTTASSTTYTVLDQASQTTSWVLVGKPFLYYRANTVGSGTSTYTVKGQVMTVHPR